MLTSPTQRKLRTRLKFVFFLLLVFSLTLFLCGVVFYFSHPESHVILSPLNSGIKNNSQDSVSRVQDICTRLHLVCEDVTEADDTIRLVAENNIIVLLSAQKDIPFQLTSLQSVVSQLTIKVKLPKQIDFRFAQPIVTF